MFLMKPHYHSVGLLELHQCQCELEGISNKILYGDNRNSHGLCSESHSLSESQRNTGRETLTSGLRRESASR